MRKEKKTQEQSKEKAQKLTTPATRGKNKGGQTPGQFEMKLKERGRGNTTAAGGAPRQVY